MIPELYFQTRVHIQVLGVATWPCSDGDSACDHLCPLDVRDPPFRRHTLTPEHLPSYSGVVQSATFHVQQTIEESTEHCIIPFRLDHHTCAHISIHGHVGVFSHDTGRSTKAATHLYLGGCVAGNIWSCYTVRSSPFG